LPKPLTSKPGTSAAVSIIINALMTSTNRPKVNTDNGAVNNHSTGRTDALIRASTVAAIIKAIQLLAFIPGVIKIAMPSPVRVAAQTNSRVIIIMPEHDYQ